MFGKSRKSSPSANKAKLDALGGYSLEQLLGLPLLTQTKKEKKSAAKAGRRAERATSGRKGVVRKVASAPLSLAKAPTILVTRLVGGIWKALLEVLALPLRVLGALASPWRRS